MDWIRGLIPQGSGAGNDRGFKGGAQLSETLVVGEIFLEGGNFPGGDVAREVAAVFPCLEFVVGTEANGSGSVRCGPGAEHFAELTAFHPGDGGDLLEDGLGLGCLVLIHTKQIPSLLGIVKAKQEPSLRD